MKNNLLTLEGFSISLPKIPRPSIPIPSLNLDAIKAQTADAINQAKNSVKNEMEIVKQNLMMELKQSQELLKNQAAEEIKAVKLELEKNVKEKKELSKNMRLNELSNSLYKDITGQSLADYIEKRSAVLQDDLLKLEKDYLQNRYNEIKNKVKADLKKDLTDLYIKTYLKVTGKELPESEIQDIEKMQKESLQAIENILSDPFFVEKVISKISLKIGCPEKTKKYIIDFLNICVPDFMNIGEQIPKILEKFDADSVYFLLESINYIAVILEQKGQYIIENRLNDKKITINFIVDNTEYIPGSNPYKKLEEKNIIPGPDIIKVKSELPADKKEKTNYIPIIAGIAGVVVITKILKVW